MATTTPNYGWAVPTSTDLVKDGATAIETLGDAIDASMNTALGTKKAGMVLLNTTSFSGVSSQRVNPFSATYQNYRIVYASTQSTVSPMKFRLASGASVISTSTYRRGGWYVSSGSGTGTFFNSSSETSVIFTQFSGLSTIDISSPFDAAVTHLNYDTGIIDTTNYLRISGLGYNTNATSYDGFELSPDAGTMTGTVRVYGYNN
jgi:hypothetical protein